MIDEMEIERLRAIEEAAHRHMTSQRFPDIILAGMDLRALLGCSTKQDEENRGQWERHKAEVDRALAPKPAPAPPAPPATTIRVRTR